MNKDGIMLNTSRSVVRFFTIIFLFSFYTSLSFLLPGTDVSAQENTGKTVAVLPFTMHAPSSLAYLQAGLRDMLASRLASNGGAAIVDRSSIDALVKEPGKVLQQNEAADLAQQLGFCS